MTIFYKYGGKLYINITNRCPCSCVFCLRQKGDAVGDADTLWLEREPTYEEIIEAFEKFDKTGIKDIIFCGYGEPLERLDIVLKFCGYLRRNTNMKIRINTNGLSDLINGKETAPLFKGLVDIVSVSLNASTAAEYCRICRPEFGERSFESMLNFAKGCMKSVGNVVFSVVDVVSPQEIQSCRKLASDCGIPLRVRQYIE